MENPKTYKREVGGVLLLALMLLHLWGVFKPEAGEAAEFLTLPIFTFAGAAFGLDAFLKNKGK